MTGLDGAVVIVTGAGGGIGRAAVSAFSAEGAYVLATGRSGSGLEETVALAKNPERVTPLRCDVTDGDDVANTVAHAITNFGRLDCAFNNAGTSGRRGLLHDDDEENFNTLVDTNLRGLWLCLKHQISAMIAHGGGSIVNCSSATGNCGRPDTAMQAATKHAVIGLSKSAALQYAGDGVRVNVVSPDGTDAEMIWDLWGSPQALDARHTPLRQRPASPEEVANTAVWLASPLAGNMTGQVLTIDGWVSAAV